MQKQWYIYIIRCADNSLYTGVTTDVDRRVVEHNTSKKGAKYTRTRRPVTLVYTKEMQDHSKACIKEAQIKKLNKKQKEELIK